jgi:hypothetical protein
MTTTTTKRTIQTAQKDADKRARKVQLNFTQLMITNKGKQPTQDKRKEEKNKTQRAEL